jgi:NTP pyrophosphatase (non-canonical NTP hydrolase)
MSLNNLQELMTITMEECGELTQQCSKIMRKYESLDLISEEERVKLVEEAGDLFCMLRLLIDNRIVTWKELSERADVKREKLKTWSNLIGVNKCLD